MKTYQVTVAPASEPVTLAALKRHLRIDWADDDAVLNDMLVSARQWLERIGGRLLLTQTVQMVTTLYDDIIQPPISRLISDRYGEGTLLAVELQPNPVQSVTTVEFETKTNTWRQLNSGTEYLYDDLGNESSPYIYIADYVLSYWTGTYSGVGVYPEERRGPRLRVTYQAGYGANASSVPYTLQQAILQAAAFLYDNRGAPIPNSLIPSEFMPWRL